MEKCFNDISVQFKQCNTIATATSGLKSLSVQVHNDSLPNINKLGYNQNELFPIEQSLEEHARLGNYANVLLQYMIGDLLATRLAQKANTSIVSNNELANSETSESRPASSVSPIDAATNSSSVCNNNNNGGIYSPSHEAPSTPDLAAINSAINGSDIDTLNLDSVLQTTEVIEAQNLHSTANMSHFNNSDSSYGLNNICSSMATPEQQGQQQSQQGDGSVSTDQEKSSFVDNSSNSSAVPAATAEGSDQGQSLAPSPTTTSSSITPPIVSNVPRASVDSSDSGINVAKPFSYLDAAKKPAKPQPEPQPKNEVVKVPPVIKQIKSPHCWMKITVDGQFIGRVVFQLRPDKAPKMCENFLGLCLGKPGYGYKGTHFFKNGDGFLAGGDVEYDDGSGGYSIFGKKKFEADLCPLKDEVGMIRFKGNGTSEGGRGMVGSQFMVWYAEREFKKFSYSLVFGRVVDGLDVVKRAAVINLSLHDVMIEDCGGVI